MSGRSHVHANRKHCAGGAGQGRSLGRPVGRLSGGWGLRSSAVFAASARRRRPLSVWELLPKVEPALSEWAAFFAAGAAKRAAAEAGLPRAVSPREADDLLRDAETFLSLAENALGVPSQPLLPLLTAG